MPPWGHFGNLPQHAWWNRDQNGHDQPERDTDVLSGIGLLVSSAKSEFSGAVTDV